MKFRKSGSQVLWYECLGFGLILLLSWLNKAVDLPHLIVGGEAHASVWRDSFMETMLILLIWAFVLSLTRRLVDRLHHLEGLLRVCAWCRKVGHGNRWMRLEDYFAEGFQIATTHGVCPDCMKRMEEDTRQYYRLQGQTAPTPLPPTNPEPEQPSLAA